MLQDDLGVVRLVPAREGHQAMPDLRKLFQRRMELHRRRALAYAESLRKPLRPDTVHKLRTHLRRFQAHAELLEHHKIAARFARCVSCFSRLRSLHVFKSYLKGTGASVKNRQRFQRAVRKEEKKIRASDRLQKVRVLLLETPISSLERPNIFLKTRLERLRHENRTMLHQALQDLSRRPKWKELHRLRLLIKSLRYQQEIAVELKWGNPRTLHSLKCLQQVLGDFCDREQFVRLAKELDLSGRKKIKKDRRRYLKRARRALRRLSIVRTGPSAVSSAG
jgi:CHAD domain-containing protein